MSRRLLFVSHYSLPHLGGIEVVIDALARELARRGHEVVHLASDARDGAVGPVKAPTDYRLVTVGAANGLERRAGIPYPVFGPGLLPAVRAEVPRADVVHVHGLLYMSSVAALLAARARGARGPARVLSEHVGHVDWPVAVLDRLQAAAIASVGRLSARSAEAIVTMNPKVADELRRLAPAASVHLIANGVDTESYRPPTDEERARLRSELGWDDRPRVLFVGRLVAKKGVAAAVDAARAGGGDFELVIVGPGSPPPAVDGSVSVLGPLPPDRVAELLRAADAFLLPSRGEGFPVTAQEAMASGLPVVLADDPAYAPHVRDAGPGVQLVRPEGPALAEALRGVLGSPQARADAGRRAAEHARRAFSWPAAADAHEELYERLLAARGRVGG